MLSAEAGLPHDALSVETCSPAPRRLREMWGHRWEAPGWTAARGGGGGEAGLGPPGLPEGSVTLGELLLSLGLVSSQKWREASRIPSLRAE